MGAPQSKHRIARLAAQIILVGNLARCIVQPMEAQAASNADLTQQCVHLAQTKQVAKADRVCALAMRAVRKATTPAIHQTRNEMIVDLAVVPQPNVLDYSRVAEALGIVASEQGHLITARYWFQTAYKWSHQIANDYAPYQGTQSLVVSARQLARRQKAEIARAEERLKRRP